MLSWTVKAITSMRSSAALLNSTDCADIHFSWPAVDLEVALVRLFNGRIGCREHNFEHEIQGIIYRPVSETGSIRYFVGWAAVGSHVDRYPADSPDLRIVLIFNSESAIILEAFGVEAV
ncbi:hypothetical protein BO85DRAFT_491118 [Aspergillus piperis CBS 112811]|uniref:Uncharacterized protein n=1 Tax=Aspergillus piperis CBS 112811 TaxID=1448313 RepID=A0A8G1VL65_9EURO|nr:hypothetical protein BO85DRAFT_491118 [Aspergillus piperis CBS 112811]RAH54398.1 hypothetical protein BO85DRAFT_491118 [Aspergillus piperis CBS 112811]